MIFCESLRRSVLLPSSVILMVISVLCSSPPRPFSVLCFISSGVLEAPVLSLLTSRLARRRCRNVLDRSLRRSTRY
ncbi:hypothetical protein V1527DRAFT_464848 [Lipomyces starkeyi]